MKQTNLNGYCLAIFVVDKSLHVTVTCENGYNSVNLRELLHEKEVHLELFNEFTKTFGDLPTDYRERTVTSGEDNNREIGIIIIK